MKKRQSLSQNKILAALPVDQNIFPIKTIEIVPGNLRGQTEYMPKRLNTMLGQHDHSAHSSDDFWGFLNRCEYHWSSYIMTILLI